MKANGSDSSGDIGGIGKLGGFSGVNAGQISGNGPGAPLYTSTVGHGAAYGAHGSGEARTYGKRDLSSLQTWKCRWFLQYRWIWSWRWAISLKAATEIIIEPNILVSANGEGSDTSAAGTGGSIRLEATGFLIMVHFKQKLEMEQP